MNTNEIMPWDDKCQLYQLFDLLGKKWTIFILFCIKNNINSFNAIMKRLPKINSKVLSERLDLLLERGIIIREVSMQKPLKVTYKLTPYGIELSQKLNEIGNWELERGMV